MNQALYAHMNNKRKMKKKKKRVSGNHSLPTLPPLLLQFWSSTTLATPSALTTDFQYFFPWPLDLQVISFSPDAA
jgi:hypothetical protein